MFGLFGARPAAGEDEAAAEAEPLGSGAERPPGRPPEAEPGGEQLAAQRLPLSEPRSFTFEEAGPLGITTEWHIDGVAIKAVKGAALEQGVPRMSVILALNGSDASGLARAELLAMLKVRPLTLTVRPPADLRGEQLEGRDLQGVTLPEARLAGANLKGSDLRGADLEKAVLQEGYVLAPPDVEGLGGAALGKAWEAWGGRGWRRSYQEYFKPAEEGAEERRAAVLSGAKLAGTNLRDADLRKVKLDNVEGSEGVVLLAVEGKKGKELGEAWMAWGKALRNEPGESVRVANLYKAQLEGASLTRAQLQGADLRYAQLQGADLYKAQLQGACLIEAQLQGADLGGVQLQGAELSAAQLQGADLSEAQLEGADLQMAQLQGASLGRAQLQGADLRWAQLQGADLYQAQLQVASLAEAQLEGAHLYEAQLEGADLRSAQLEGANLEGADLRGADLTGANLAGANLKNADLRGAVLIGVNLEKADLEGAKLQGAKFERAVLAGVKLIGAKFSPFKPPEARPPTLARAWRLRAVGGQAAKGLYAALAGGDSDGGSDDEGAEEEEEEEGTATNIVANALEAGVTALVKAAAPALELVEEIIGKLRAALNGCIAVLKAAGDCDKPAEFLCDATRKLVRLLVSELLQPLLAVCSDPPDSWASLREGVLLKLEPQPKELLGKLAASIAPSVEPESTAEAEPPPAAAAAAAAEGGEAAGELLRELLRLIAEEATAMLPALEESVEAVVSKTLQMLSLHVEDVELGLVRDFTAVADRLEKHLETVLIEEGIGKLVSKEQALTMNGSLSIGAVLEKLSDVASEQLKLAEQMEKTIAAKVASVGDAANQKLLKFVGGKGSIKSRVVKSVLSAATKYELNVDDSELTYLLDTLVKLEALEVKSDTWKDAASTWMSVLELRRKIGVERGIAVIDCIAGDQKARLSKAAGGHIRANGYSYRKKINLELARIRRVRDLQMRGVALVGTAIAAALISTFNYLYSVADGVEPWWLPPAVVLGVLCVLLPAAAAENINKQARTVRTNWIKNKQAANGLFSSAPVWREEIRSRSATWQLVEGLGSCDPPES
ncbi:hypothetical protein EMIHUDRAFT_469324 [Emiliania huxleyi CCMP1516]|uniref:Uncharacterized protein n=4 Tax=Emiliania huxleyi TaxID=2903 RepID=A0A0D3JLK9_EMIH1|nr:hypothetical protein EMIHUDRAFT_469324 [Emiliania huxleyi CCMP1516]EOD24394.1 hypothetical protein EMIHUDRAFT_469324 [Emiliania huxleyi CCMP1516]|eukprot:XP_005776823.1 hypothetical protein EMIHUDRAFT_469324 [Emiliania huxleyi CCMP1516]